MKLALHAGDGDKKPDRREEHGISRSNHRAGNAGVIGEPVVTCLRAFYFCTQGCGCAWRAGIPCALSVRGREFQDKTRADDAARARRCVLFGSSFRGASETSELWCAIAH